MLIIVGVSVLWAVAVLGCSSHGSIPDEPVAGARQGADSKSPSPVAVVDETEAFLGIVDPSEEVEKLFAIRNEGEAPLRLERGGTSCTCTMSSLPDRPVMPGEAAVVRVSTKSEEKEGKFDHTASVLTNDPHNRRITFRVRGTFQKVVAFDPPKLILSDLKRGESATVETTAYSQVFRSFELESIESTLAGLSWKVQPADQFSLDRLEARCGYRIELKVPEITDRDFWETLTIKVRSDDSPSRLGEAACKIAGSVTARADFRGKNLDARRILNLGSLSPWQGAEERLTLTVRDEHRNLQIKSIEKDPDFLRVDVTPVIPEKPDSGLYWVNVTVPKDAPASNYVGSRKGEVRIITDHPDVPVMSFWVQFAVTSS